MSFGATWATASAPELYAAGEAVGAALEGGEGNCTARRCCLSLDGPGELQRGLIESVQHLVELAFDPIELALAGRRR